MLRQKDTIAAISTPRLTSGIGVIRLSGPRAVEIADYMFNGTKPLSEAFSHTVHFGKIIIEGKVVDEVLATVMLSPKSYTGEDTVELSCHGSPFILDRVLSKLIEFGARQAGPGEFTMRAFVNGHMDMSQAEAVMDLISSENDRALRNSMDQLSGNYSALLKEIRQSLVYEVAFIESALDDPEHISLEGYKEHLIIKVDEELKKIRTLIESASIGERIRDGVDCLIVGRTNVGKSSLLNVLSGEEAAIVTEIPGTTRDVIKQRVNLGDFTLNIIDTAGIRQSSDPVETIGINKSVALLDRVGIIIFVADSSVPLSEEDEKIISRLDGKNVIGVLNKSDLGALLKTTDLPFKSCIRVSAKTLEGIGELKKLIISSVTRDEAGLPEGHAVTNKRHLRLLEDAANSLELVKSAVAEGFEEDVFSIDLTDAYESLGKILGESLEDDVIEEIFSKFCVGK